jgi:hypothetical protein
MERLHKSMNAYTKSLSRKGESSEDKEKGLPVSYLGRTMIAHGEDFEPDSEFGNSLIGVLYRVNCINKSKANLELHSYGPSERTHCRHSGELCGQCHLALA